MVNLNLIFVLLLIFTVFGLERNLDAPEVLHQYLDPQGGVHVEAPKNKWDLYESDGL